MVYFHHGRYSTRGRWEAARTLFIFTAICVAAGWPLTIGGWWKWPLAAADWAVLAVLLAGVLYRGHQRIKARRGL